MLLPLIEKHLPSIVVEIFDENIVKINEMSVRDKYYNITYIIYFIQGISSGLPLLSDESGPHATHIIPFQATQTIELFPSAFIVLHLWKFKTLSAISFCSLV